MKEYLYTTSYVYRTWKFRKLESINNNLYRMIRIKPIKISIFMIKSMFEFLQFWINIITGYLYEKAKMAVIIQNNYFFIPKIHKHFFFILQAFERCLHYSDIIMNTEAFQITSVMIVYSIVCSGTDLRKYQSSTLLAFVSGIHRWPVNSPHKGLIMQKMFPFDDVIMDRWWHDGV